MCVAIRKKKKLSSNDNDVTMMDSASASAPPADITYYNVPPTRDYYNVNVVDQGSYGQLSDVANDTHTYDQLNKTTVH